MTPSFSKIEEEQEELPELELIAEKTEKQLEEMPCLKNVLLADRDTDIWVASKGTEMTSSPFEVEVELDRLQEPNLIAKKDETERLANQNTPERPKVRYI